MFIFKANIKYNIPRGKCEIMHFFFKVERNLKARKPKKKVAQVKDKYFNVQWWYYIVHSMHAIEYSFQWYKNCTLHKKHPNKGTEWRLKSSLCSP